MQATKTEEIKIVQTFFGATIDLEFVEEDVCTNVLIEEACWKRCKMSLDETTHCKHKTF